MRKALVLVIVAAAALAPRASAARGLFVGVDEDGFKSEPAAAARDARRLGLSAFRITLLWAPGRRRVTSHESAVLRRAVAATHGLRPVLAVYAQKALDAPTTAERRGEYCSFVRSALARVPRLNDVVIWNEPNKSFFWRPQFNEDGTSAAPAAYEALLARCWDALHSLRSTVNMIGPATAPRGNDDPNAVSNVSHSPATFIRKLGHAYRASGRRQRIVDTIGHHVHGLSAAEAPSASHVDGMIEQGDLGRLLTALRDAFSGTAQPYPGHCVSEHCVPIWYLEAGFQTTPDQAKRGLYTDRENEPRPLPDEAEGEGPDQAGQILAGIRLAYCQPFVEAYFNFLLWDERSLVGWQSAPYWVDRTPKDSFPAFKEAIREANERKVDCGTVEREAPTAVSTKPPPPPHAPKPGAPRSRTTSTPHGTAPPGAGTGASTSTSSVAAATGAGGGDGSGWKVLLAAALAAAAAGGAALTLLRRARRHGRGGL